MGGCQHRNTPAADKTISSIPNDQDSSENRKYWSRHKEAQRHPWWWRLGKD